jgi:putative endonuclease
VPVHDGGMPLDAGPPSGPRGRTGAAAEAAAADHLISQGWTILARNVRVVGVELDIVACPPAAGGLPVVVEVRARTGRAFGSAVESVDGRKVARLYRAARALGRSQHVPRVDLLALRRAPSGAWVVEAHLRGLEPPAPGH